MTSPNQAGSVAVHTSVLADSVGGSSDEAHGFATSGFRIPSPPKGMGAAKWIPPGTVITVSGKSDSDKILIPGGMIYVGTSLPSLHGGNDPSLIDPRKAVAAESDFRVRQTDYWPSYSDISPKARRAYLNWLADGRKHPGADVGYVFLFFYGLERRVIVDAGNDANARADRPAIADEVRRLLAIYGGEVSYSFRRYASEFLDYLTLADASSRLYERPVPTFPRGYELPFYLRLALGQAAVDGVPVPTHLALAWARLDPAAGLRTPAIRCPEQFERLFAQKYEEMFGEGLKLPRNRTKLKLVYRPASAALAGADELTLSFGGVPDVAALTAPVKKLQQIIDAATADLDAYSRYLGRYPDAANSLEALIQLPAWLWPETTQQTLRGLKARMVDGVLQLKLSGLLELLGAKSVLTRPGLTGLARALADTGIGIEPDILNGARVPKPEGMVVLFVETADGLNAGSTAAYRAAQLTLQLASTVASADGEFSDGEVQHLRQEVQAWVHLTEAQRHRLWAHIELLRMEPLSLAVLKKKLEPLDKSAKESIAVFMAALVQSDGIVSAGEIRLLEKVYKVLDIDTAKVFSDVHSTSVRELTDTPRVSNQGVATPEKGSLRLDPMRIAELQKDTEKVSALLAGIFKEEETRASVQAVHPAVVAESPLSGLLGLDESHSAFARMLLSRPQWAREELVDVCADLDLMLDGALERINEASFDVHDMPFTEGDDPVAISAELMEKIEA
ncbi:TerB N-terminal domain-containing protein [Cupriavidus basilensis]|uniref:tellurite resistance TerB family protein n=1 Tax=Cupriavidus basilensis TaxID=68895 RepID=UPI001E34B4A6|nr:TerB N-terminal domain-containing protein [Cupriavidus basilensis]